MSSLEAMGDALREIRTRFEDEVEPHRAALWRYCLRLTGSAWDAEDLVQDTMVKAVAGLARLWQPLEPRAYLFRIATNAWIDRHRRESRAEWADLPDEVPAEGPLPDLRLEAHDAIALLVDRLPPMQRAVFLLCETLGFTGREAAALVGRTEGAVKAALHRARRRLAEDVAEDAGERGEAIARLADPDSVDPVVRRWIEAFDARDPDALAALLHEDAVTEIVGSAEEIGREVSRRGSLAEWAAEPVEQWARPGVLEGEPVLFVFAPREGGEALYSLLRLETAGDAVARQRIYYYAPELLEHAAAALGVPARTHGHRWEGEAG